MFPAHEYLTVNITAALKKDGPNEIGIGPSSWLNGSFTPDRLNIASVKLYVAEPNPISK